MDVGFNDLISGVIVRCSLRLDLRGYRLGTKQFSARSGACTMVHRKTQTFHPRFVSVFPIYF